MKKLQTNVSDIKSVAKILKQELAKMNFTISYSSALNLASRSLGFKNYQTYKGLFNQKDEISYIANEYDKYINKMVNKRIAEYPSIHNFFIKLGSILNYDMFIYKENLEHRSNYLILFEIKNSYTGRMFFHAKDNTFFIFKKYISYIAYEYQIHQENIFYYFNMINQVKEKTWATQDMIDDLMELIESVLSDKEQLKKITAKYSNKKLEEIYNKLN
jgi:hypothetical protein